ncbi:hypothetical protein M5K25_020154 [Dendrobium thyrsiflorum]|uniref:Uncharacterized protein n=1 Tax=Dendrobium thyrsiflorum TaxID=117978 RepID=A0ABD0U9Z6_DENTH
MELYVDTTPRTARSALARRASASPGSHFTSRALTFTALSLSSCARAVTSLPETEPAANQSMVPSSPMRTL